MLIVLPPSETKATGGTGSALDMDALHFPALTPFRRRIATDLVDLCTGDVVAAREALGLSERLSSEVTANAELLSSPTMPALQRYTGVLYDALDAATLPTEAWRHLAIGSALFGVVMGSDPIPHYRLSGGTKLPTAAGELPTMKARWGTAIKDALTEIHSQGLLIDLRSGTYQQLGKVPSAVTVRVEAVQQDGSRKVVSHFNKHYKGLLARTWAEYFVGATAPQIPDLIAAAEQAGYRLEHKGGSELTMVVDPG
ncbi:MAG TPA: peroxide stress protein YaaA [Candidatus Corynebacterium gallistercoris]|uniref:Peroxide stress protein YaaA n=1 Tax=Candidatus Corynebacterium gallistercoris TaxID=2838530 RepID=A0A9D1UQ75_9CORY|nr:peroxide stress protein YaaA [Candidatus Corynebacterium gallistercoris]